MAGNRDQWGTKLGVILAVAGSAIGLGNFLRFPVKTAEYGGGAFLIPYFVALLVIGIPLAWVEWTLGRYGGRFGHGSGPGILNAAVRRPWAKYLGSIGVFGPVLIFFYYVVIESWLLGFAWYSLTGDLLRAVADKQVGAFFGNYILLKTTILGMPAALFFFLLTFAVNFIVIGFGIRRGIELVNKIALPVLLLLGILLFVRVLTIDGIGKGLGFMWNPDLSRLLDFRVWLEAAGQIFFTLSVGIGAILTYASYIKKDQDIALSSLTSCATNEFTEVILGGTIVVPLAVVIYGATNIQEIATLGTMGLSFQTMPQIFGVIPLGGFFQFIWFFLLFIAGITSSISVLQPGISFFEDEAGYSKRRAVAIVGSISLLMGLVALYGTGADAIDEMDFWAVNICLILFGMIEAIVFAWIYGIDRGWKELNRGSDIRIPRFFRFTLKWITPTFLIVLLGGWLVTQGVDTITMKGLRDRGAQRLELIDGSGRTVQVRFSELAAAGRTQLDGWSLPLPAGAADRPVPLGAALGGSADREKFSGKVTSITGKRLELGIGKIRAELGSLKATFLGLEMPKTTFLTGIRLLLLAFFIFINIMIHRAWRRRRIDERLAGVQEEEAGE